ncbi:MAG: hypothetical protein P8173_15670 [Gammaproteobacteria bacterium]
MRIIPCTMAAFLFSAAAPALAVNNSLDGGTGLVVMRTADTLPRGRLALSTFAWGRAVRDTGDNLDWDALVMPQLSYGLFSFLEVGLGAPYMTNIDSSASGLPRVNGDIKLRFFDPAGAGITAAVTAYGGFLPSKHTDVASGDNNYGAELNISMPRLLKPLGIFHASLGVEKSDTKVATGIYRREIKKRLNLGVEVPLGQKWNASMELMLARAENVDDTATLVPGLRYTPSDRLTWLLAASWGTPKGIARPEVRVLGGVNYTFGGGTAAAAGPKSSPPVPGNGDAAAPSNTQ